MYHANIIVVTSVISVTSVAASAASAAAAAAAVVENDSYEHNHLNIL